MTEKLHRTHASHEADSASPQREPPVSANEFAPEVANEFVLEPRARTLLDLQNTIGNQAVQRAITSAPTAPTEDDLAQRIRAASSGGHTLDAATRERLQAGLGVDLSGVRLHVDVEADRLAESVEAVAFTTGNNIFFRAGMYQPDTASGFHLLTHEVTHTVQQASGPVEGTPGAGGVSISDPADQHEQAAEQTAQAVLAGQAVTLGSSGQSGMAETHIQRWEWGDLATEAAWGAAGAIPGLGGIAQFGRGVYDRYQAGSALPQGTSQGIEPSATDPGAYAYQKHNEQGGVESGIGAFHGEGDIGGVPVTDDILNIDEKIGAWGDNGGTRYGYNLGGGVAKMGFNKGGAVSGDVGAGTFGLDASINPDQGLSVGAQANILEGSMTLGNFTGDDNAEESLRLGASLGEGYAGRLHWGDSDSDQHREYGFGFDAGPVSMDVKTEDPLRTAIKGGLMSNPMTMPLGIASQYLMPEGNLTDTAGEYAGAAWDSAGSAASGAWDYLTDW
ncbi:MAG: DUF4157 domain-containing protein [Chloroflexi bacterium]|nr:DUF4157 domain-containing protein [Chloroflexota bacterium]